MNHHAYYIEASQTTFESYKSQLHSYYARQYEKFGIDEARELVMLATLKNEKEAIYFLGIASITTEAQQALLKLFEEPQEGNVFIVLVPHGVLLPTVMSRMMRYQEEFRATPSKKSSGHSQPDFLPGMSTKFLSSNSKDRSAQIAELLKDEDGVKERVRDFLNALEAELYVRLRKSNTKQDREALEDIAKVRSYVSDRSPSLKMLLEHLALALPTL